MRLNESRCQKSTATNEFAFLALNPPFYFYNWLQIQTIRPYPITLYLRESFQTIPGLSWFIQWPLLYCMFCKNANANFWEICRREQTKYRKINTWMYILDLLFILVWKKTCYGGKIAQNIKIDQCFKIRCFYLPCLALTKVQISYGVSMRIMIVKDNNTLGLHCKGYKDLISNSLIQYIQENTIN